MASEIDLPPFSPLRKSRSFNSLSLPPSSSALSVEGLEIETDQTLPSSFSLPPTDPVIGTNTTSLLEPCFTICPGCATSVCFDPETILAWGQKTIAACPWINTINTVAGNINAGG
ncbi:hypothetical protein Bca101_004857 [Brassica carinata]